MDTKNKTHLPTLAPLDRLYAKTMGMNLDTPTFYDVLAVNEMYCNGKKISFTKVNTVIMKPKLYFVTRKHSAKRKDTEM